MSDPVRTKSYDQSGKFLSDRDPIGFLRLLGAIEQEETVEIEVVERELLTPSRAVDRLYRVWKEGASRLVHGEVQARWKVNVPSRVTDYGARIYLLTGEAVESYVLLLTDDPAPPSDPPLGVIQCGDLTITKGYKLIFIGDCDADEWLARNRLYILPLVPLMHDGDKRLREVVNAIGAINDEDERKQLAAYFAVLSGLKYDQAVIDQLLEELAMNIPMEQLRDSIVAQTWLMEGREEGREEGRIEEIYKFLRRATEMSFPSFDPSGYLEGITDLEALEELALTMYKLPDAAALEARLKELQSANGRQ